MGRSTAAGIACAGASALMLGRTFVAPQGSRLAAQAPVAAQAAAAPQQQAADSTGSFAQVAGVAVLASGGAAVALRRKESSASSKRNIVATHAYENAVGVQPPVGFWDPLGLAAGGNASDFARRREVELKHGRVAMFAAMGYIAPEYTRLTGDLSPSYGIKFADVPNGLAALGKVPAVGWAQIVVFLGSIELFVYSENNMVKGDPGNYGAGFLGLRSVGIVPGPFADEETRKKKLNAEIANGRLAMMAIIGMFFQDGLTGSAWGDWALYTDSPLR